MSNTVAFSDIDETHTYDAVILGAGPAGISAAKTLLGKGCTNILVVEGRDRMGGRVHTHPEFGDLGAAWTHINDPSLKEGGAHVSEMANVQAGLLTPAQKGGYTLSYDRQNSKIYCDGQHVPRDRYLGNLNKVFGMLENLVKKHGDMSVGEAKRRLIKEENIDGFLQWVVDIEFGWESTGSDIEKVSVAESLKVFSLASGLLYREGHGNLIQEMGETIKGHTCLESRVTSIKKGFATSEVGIVAPDGTSKKIRANHVLCTIPPSVLNHKGDAFEIKLEGFPQSKLDAIKALPSGAMNKVILNFPDGFLERLGIEDNQHYEIMRRGLGSMFFLARPAGKNQIVAFLGGEKSIEIEKIEPEADRTAAAVNYILPFFEEVEGLGKIAAGNIKNAHFTTWYKDEFARGAYSVPVVGAANARAEMFKPIDNKIFFAGEACATGG
jgi:monoamine oxidase